MKPNPGSDKAIELGCTCPILDNGHGKGLVYDGIRNFWINATCPVHTQQAIKSPTQGEGKEGDGV